MDWYQMTPDEAVDKLEGGHPKRAFPRRGRTPIIGTRNERIKRRREKALG